ncbi:hypothetical protein ACFV2N_02845 [Streptomyces sp. NPDC059680]|uniref:hypothetical protein n=1 Tax=Streptomyces sp. NPDC059680 TaxID=3346904 RepID=UPI0036B9092F
MDGAGADHHRCPAGFYTASDTNGNGMGRLQWFAPAGTTPDGAYWSRDTLAERQVERRGGGFT